MDAAKTLHEVNRLIGLTIATQSLFDDLDLRPEHAALNKERNKEARDAIWSTLDCMREILGQLRGKLDNHAAWQAVPGGAERIQSELLSELKASHKIIKNALAVMTTKQKAEWGKLNERDGVDDLVGEGVTRANERESVIAKAEQA